MTSKSRLLTRFLFASMCAAPALASPAYVGWSDLAPVASEIANPFESLASNQLEALRRIVRLEGIGDKESRTEAAQLRSNLEAEGVDIDELLAARIQIMDQRRAAFSAVNEALIGREIRIPGYILPLEMRDRKAVEFLLVPTVGACIHTPPPPANQLIRVVYPEGVEINGLYNPVWVTGVLEAVKSMPVVGYSDGRSKVEVSYSMRSEQVELY